MWRSFGKNSLFCAIFFLCSCKRSQEDRPAILYLASSLLPLKSSIETLAKKPLDLKFLSSSAIAQQLSQGAPCDGVVVADEEWQNFLNEKKFVDAKITVIATNSLVLASKQPQEKTFELSSLAQLSEKIILADPAYVPLGKYTEASLRKLGLFEKLKNHFILTHSAQMAVMLLKEGAASWAFLYQSDVDNQQIFKIVSIDKSMHEKIIYPFMVCVEGKEEYRKDIEKILLSTEFKSALKERGFGVPDEC